MVLPVLVGFFSLSLSSFKAGGAFRLVPVAAVEVEGSSWGGDGEGREGEREGGEGMGGRRRGWKEGGESVDESDEGRNTTRRTLGTREKTPAHNKSKDSPP